MKKNKIILSLLLIVFSFLCLSFVNVKAENTNVSEELKIENVSIRETSKLGLEFSATVNNFDITNVKKYGVIIAYGETEANDSFVKDATINGKVVLSGEVKNTLNGVYTVTLVNIPELEYLTKVTARSYVETEDKTIYSLTSKTISIGEVALENKRINKETERSKEVLNKVDTNFVNTGINSKGNTFVSTDFIERHYKNLYLEFIDDYNKLFNKNIETFTPLSFFEELKSSDVNDLSESNLYLFFNDSSLKDKWAFLIDYFETCEDLREVMYQAKAIKGNGRTPGKRLYAGSHLIYSIYNFFNASNEKGNFRSIYFTILDKYEEATMNCEILLRFDRNNFQRIGETITLPDAPIAGDGYSWKSFQDDGKEYQPGDVITLVDKDMEFVPTYNLIEYSIKYMFEGNEIETTNPTSYNYRSETIVLDNLAKEGYTFEGWFDNPGFTGEPVKTIEYHSFGDIVLYAKLIKIGSRVENTNKELVEFFNKLGTIESNIDLPKRNEQEDTYITWESSNPDIISNKGKLKRDYKPSKVVLTATIKCGENSFKYTYELNVAGYKSLVNIASSYIYTGYGAVTPLFFDTLDIINCAFVTGNGNGTLTGGGFYNNVMTYIMDKAHEQGIYVVASVGPGSSWSTFANPKNNLIPTFASNVVKMINQYGFDGVDLDWETPNSDESTWFTALSKEVYGQVKKNNPNHLVTAAIAGGMWQPVRYDLPNSKQYLDYINLMCYGMVSNGGGYQNALYPASGFHDTVNRVGSVTRSCSIKESVEFYKKKFGVNADQLIAGFAFYGMTQKRELKSDGTYTAWEHYASPSFTTIKESYLTDPNYKEVFDERAGVPYIISNDGLTFISYDNARSVSLKCQYALDNNLAGLMYWQNGQDRTDTLLGALKAGLHK